MIGILGGTFDPVHYGHLRPAQEARRHARLDELRLVPCAQPPHRDPPYADAHHRLRMVELAVAREPGLAVDDREIRMGGVSYTVRTLRDLRKELGDAPLALVLGADAFLGLPTWFTWEEIPRLAHLVVMDRPGWDVAAGVPAWAAGRLCADPAELRGAPAGRIYRAVVTPVDISSTAVRNAVARGQSIDGLVPPPVIDYIERYALYRDVSTRQGVV